MKTQKDLANCLQITQGPVSDAKRRGVFPREWAHKIAKKYGVSMDWILMGKGPMLNEPNPEPKLEQEVREGSLELPKKFFVLQKKLQYILEKGNLGQQKDIRQAIEEVYDEIFLDSE